MTGPILTGRYDPDELPFSEREFIYFGAYMVRAIMLNDVGYESCVLTSKLVSELYTRLGIRTMPIICQVTALNPAAWERVEDGGKIELFADPDEDAYATNIPHDPERHSPEALQGHLAVIVANRYLVDASIDQLARPDRNLYIDPLILEFGEDDDSIGFEGFIGGDPAMVNLPNGGGMIYQPHAEDLEYLNGADWQEFADDPKSMEVLDGAMGLIQFALDEGEFPSLPRLPTSISLHAGKVLDACRQHKLSADETVEVFQRHGLSIERYANQIETVVQRMQRRR